MADSERRKSAKSAEVFENKGLASARGNEAEVGCFEEDAHSSGKGRNRRLDVGGPMLGI